MEIGAIFILSWVIAIIAYAIISGIKNKTLKMRGEPEVIFSIGILAVLAVSVLLVSEIF